MDTFDRRIARSDAFDRLWRTVNFVRWVEQLMSRTVDAAGRKEFNHASRERILVTGGWFPGSHLCERLVRGGARVICLDNFFTGAHHNLDGQDHKTFELMRHDVTFPLFVEVDQIYNMACPASPIHYQYDPVQTTKTSVHGAINMLGSPSACARKSSGLDLGGLWRSGAPQPEEYWEVNPIGVRSCYDEGAAAPRRCSSTTGASTAPASGGAHLQHVRSAHASQRRPRGVGLHRRRCSART